MSRIISAFPGTGKTYFQKKSPLNVLDSDSSKYSWLAPGIRNPYFPNNYVGHIRESMNQNDIILVSSHKIVRDALVKNGIEYLLVFPERSLKVEYIERFKQRGNNEEFINLVSNSWDNWMSELEEQEGCSKVKLFSGQYLSDIF